MWSRNRRIRKKAWTIFAAIAVFGLISGEALSAQGKAAPFPAYGAGAIQVRLYTDYFCPPCRALEPSVEPVLRDMLKRKVITLTMVDVPMHRNSRVYAQQFIYALNVKNELENALKVRNILFDTATGMQVTTREQLEAIFKSNGIDFAVFDPKTVFKRYNALITEDGIQSTPTCVIIRKGKKKIFVGIHDTLEALKNLQ